MYSKCSLVDLCPWYRLNIPPFRRTHLVLAVSAAAALRRWIMFFKVSLNSQKIPPYGSRSSKDSGPSDCQLGAPTRPISSQGRGKKMAVSKGNTGGKSVLWRVLKYFITLDYNAAIFLPLLGVPEGQTVILEDLTYLWAVRRWNRWSLDDAF